VRLFLASDRESAAFGELIAALPTGAAVAVIANAVDFVSPEDRAAYARNIFDPAAHLCSLGLEARDLDLRDYFDRPGALGDALRDVRLIWATGGNAFLLRRAMRRSGLDALLPARLEAGDIIYGGWSAGAAVAGPTLRGLDLMDDPAQLCLGYDPEPVWEGLGLIDYSIVPHFGSDHPESAAAAEVVAWLKAHRLPFRALRDGEAIVV
jgi:dipeptidase E